MICSHAMFRNILLAVDGSEASLEAAKQGVALAKVINAKITVVVVTVPWATYFARELVVVVPDIVFPDADYEERRHSRAERLLSDVEAHARHADVAVTGVHRSHLDPSQVILDVVEHEACDAIVMAPAHHGGRSMARMLLGSETMRLITNANIPVLVHLGAKQQERAANALAMPRGRRLTGERLCAESMAAGAVEVRGGNAQSWEEPGQERPGLSQQEFLYGQDRD